jgi:hypothetical protein
MFFREKNKRFQPDINDYEFFIKKKNFPLAKGCAIGYIPSP